LWSACSVSGLILVLPKADIKRPREINVIIPEIVNPNSGATVSAKKNARNPDTKVMLMTKISSLNTFFKANELINPIINPNTTPPTVKLY
jgi:hypothetical protein